MGINLLELKLFIDFWVGKDLGVDESMWKMKE